MPTIGFFAAHTFALACLLLTVPPAHCTVPRRIVSDMCGSGALSLPVLGGYQVSPPFWEPDNFTSPAATAAALASQADPSQYIVVDRFTWAAKLNYDFPESVWDGMLSCSAYDAAADMTLMFRVQDPNNSYVNTVLEGNTTAPEQHMLEDSLASQSLTFALYVSHRMYPRSSSRACARNTTISCHCHSCVLPFP